MNYNIIRPARHALAVLSISTLCFLIMTSTAHARSKYPSYVQLEYPGTSYDCSLCHNASTTGGPRNQYGEDVFKQLGSLGIEVNEATLRAALRDIESKNSDGDEDAFMFPCSNIAEIKANTLPGTDKFPDGTSSTPDDCAPPIAKDDGGDNDDIKITTEEGTLVEIDVLNNDTSSTDRDLSVDSFDIKSTLSGTVSCDTAVTKGSNASACDYTPPAGLCGSGDDKTDTFTYTVSDGVLSSNSATVTINVGDLEAPVVTPPSILKITLLSGSSVPAKVTPEIETWLSLAMADDNEDGMLPVVTSGLSDFSIGNNPVTFSATDSCGNTGEASGTISFAFADNNNPEIILPNPASLQVTALLCANSVSQTAEANNFDGTISDWLATADATDVEDDALEKQLTFTNNAESEFPLGGNEVKFSATDSEGITNSATATVEVLETPNSTPVLTIPDTPAINLPFDDTGPVPVTDPVIATWLASASADDTEDGTLTVSNNAPTTFPLGTTPVKFTTSDRCGLSVETTIDVTIEANAPAITVDKERKVEATGYVTYVLPDATAVDQAGNVLTPATKNTGPYRPGRHLITYTATALDGKTSTTTQELDILPLVSVATTQITGEGRLVSVPVTLNGKAPTYPVTINYSVSGSASEEDHDLVVTSVEIMDDKTSAEIDIKIANDGIPEADEQIVITLINVSNNATLSDDVTHTIVITEDNIEPAVSLTIVQAGLTGHYVYKDQGQVTVTANAVDPNGDTLNYDWSQSDASLGGTVKDNQLGQIDLTLLATGAYLVEVLVSDGVNQVAHTTTLVVADTAPVLVDADTDQDKKNDMVEGRSDSDNDGLPNYLDPIDDAPTLLNLRVSSSKNNYTRLMTTTAGLRLSLNNLAILAQDADSGKIGANIFSSDVVNAAGKVVNDPSFLLVGGVYDFSIHGLSAAQRTAQVVIPLTNPIPANPTLRKFSNGTWFTFIETATDGFKSAPSVNNECPPPGSPLYKDGLIEFNDCMELTLTDGGPNDADGEANGVIRDPSAIVVPAETPSPSGSKSVSDGGSGASGWWWLILLPQLLWLHRRYH